MQLTTHCPGCHGCQDISRIYGIDRGKGTTNEGQSRGYYLGTPCSKMPASIVVPKKTEKRTA